MKLLRILMWQCELVRQQEAEDYLATHLGRCPVYIEHLLATGNSVKKVRIGCENCVLAKLYRASYVVGKPTLTSDGKILFYVRKDKKVEKILKEHLDSLVSVEVVDHREVILTPRQREAIKLLAEGEATNITRLAQKLRITKPAALRLVRRSLRKLARIYA